MSTQPKTPGALREDDLQPDDVIRNQQQPVSPKGNQDEQSRQGPDTSDELLDEEDDDEEIDELLEEEDITDEDVDEDALEEDDSPKRPLE
ncbi:hypothetical protein [Chitinophaga arvensicola]|uniref:Uncharacterized protein n=1 Tax=Chitinophaga arvensicola TaxID=29529 RepID=A0A1I0SCL3_9BACT|nr:hypothetical protein [Chitinophaga arvensicola]SEW54995.1 hypothetical protein SAMN04488122_6273 [Chitinophaga arvensicola]